MKQFHWWTSLLFVAGGKADVCETEGAYIVDIIGKSYDAVDRIDSFKCSDGSSVSQSTGGTGGTQFETNINTDPDGYVGLKSGYWTLHSEAASGLSFMKVSGNAYLGPYGSVYDGVTERLCSGGSKMNGISAATATTGTGGFTVVGVNPLPSCTTLTYKCPTGAVITSVDLYAGDGVDNISHITCTDGSGVISGKDVNIGGTGGGAGTASGGPFLGMHIGSYDSATSGVLSGLAFRKSSDGNYGDTFGIKPYNGATYPYMCAQGQVLTGLNMPQVFYPAYPTTLQLVGSGLTILCGCQSIPNCTQQDTSESSNCACTACAGGYVVNTDPSNFLTTCIAGPTPSPTSQPTAAPTKTKKPTQVPTAAPTTAAPSTPTAAPTKTTKPTKAPTAAPTPVPTPQPTVGPFSCPKGSIMKSINIAYGVALSYISSFDCTIPSSTMVTTSTVQVQIGNPGTDTVTTVQGPFTQVKKGYYVTPAGVVTDAASGVQLVNNYGTASPRFGSRYGNVTTKKCSAGQVLSGLYIAAAAGGQMVSADLSISCAAPPTKNYDCGTGAMIDSITLYADTGINAITKLTCKDSLGTITSKTVNIGKSTSGTKVTIIGPFDGMESGYAISPNPTDAASGLQFLITHGTWGPVYGTSYANPNVTGKLCNYGQGLYGLTLGWDSSGTMVGGSMSARCRDYPTDAPTSPPPPTPVPTQVPTAQPTLSTCTQADVCYCVPNQTCQGSQPGGGWYYCDACVYAGGGCGSGVCTGTFTNSHVWCQDYSCRNITFINTTLTCYTNTYPCMGSTLTGGSVECLQSWYTCLGLTVSGGTANCNGANTCNGAIFTNNCKVTCNDCAGATFNTGACCVGGTCPAGTACPP